MTLDDELDESLELIFGEKDEEIIGRVLSGKFRIVQLLGKGGFGAVYKAHQEDMDRMVALKVMKRQFIEDVNSVKRFLREVRSSSKLRHPNSVKIHEFGHTKEGLLFFTMEYLEGAPLSHAIATQAPIDEWRVRRIAVQILKSLNEAHSHGMVHRDLKPDNVMLANIHGETDFVKVLDFGIVKITGDQDGALTSTGQYFGTPKYMSPEQARGEAIDHRVDLYALGVIMYEMLTGRLPFEASSSMALILAHAQQEPPPFPDDLGITPEMKSLVMQLLTKQPDQRFQSTEQLIGAIAALPHVDPATPPAGVVLPLNLDPLVTPSASGTGRTISAIRQQGRQQIPKSTRNLLLVGIALIVAASLVALYVSLDSEKDPHAGKTTVVAKKGPKKPKKTAVPPPVVRGVSPRQILFGMSAVFSGPSRELGRSMKQGIEAVFQRINNNGGIHGRKLKLIALDDGYEPNRTMENMLELLETRKVFGFVGNVGTPTAKIAVPLAVRHHSIFFGAFTGAGLLRKMPPDRYVFNYRASYRQETAAVVNYFIKRRGIKPHEIAVFAQSDGYGDAGYRGVLDELRNHDHRRPPLRVGYRRNTIDVTSAVATMLAKRSEIKAVVMVATYRAGAIFIKKLVNQKMTPLFANVSFVGSRALAEELHQLGRKFAEGVIVTQVVPHFRSKLSGVARYRQHMKRFFPSEPLSFISLEGFLAAEVLVAALKRCGRQLSAPRLIKTLRSMGKLDLGIGVSVSFSKRNHQASHRVWGTVIDSQGHYQPLKLR